MPPQLLRIDAMKPTKEMIDRFLTWPVPASVYPDGTPGKPGRTGTNLLTATEAEQMLTHALGGLDDEIGALKAALNDAVGVLRMVDDNHRVDAGENCKAWSGDFVVAEVRRVLM
jgi:hypothetical protein